MGTKTPGPVLLIAKQRSGTNLLRRSLASTNWFVDRDEIFHSRPDLGTFWNHRALMIAHDPRLSIPHPPNQRAIFKSYLETFAPSGNKFSILDVKYNSLHSINSVWQAHNNRPLLLRYVLDHNIPVIHLTRNDELARYVSNVISDDLKVYVTPAEINLAKTWNLRIPPLLAHIKDSHFDINRTRNWLKGGEPIPTLNLEFEELLDEYGNFSQAVARKIQTFLAIPEQLTPQVLTKKMIRRPYWELIENFESEVVPALREHGYSELLPREYRSQKAA